MESLRLNTGRCLFHDGPQTIDGLLAELGSADDPAMDLALDLRSAVQQGEDAEACVRLALELRKQLDGRSYLAFYRVRQWLRRMVGVEVRAGRGAHWISFSLPLDSGHLEEVENACMAAWATYCPGDPIEFAQLRFVFLEKEPAAVRLTRA